MLAACAHSPATPPRSPDPIVETRVETWVVCPAEVSAALPAAIATPIDAAITASTEVLRWIASRFAREALLERRLTDARAECGPDSFGAGQ